MYVYVCTHTIIMNKDVMNIHIYIFGWICVFSFLETEFLGDRVGIY